MRLLVFALAAGCLYLALRPLSEEGAPELSPVGGAFPDLVPSFDPEQIMNEIAGAARSVFGSWRPPALYAAAIQRAEDINGIPRDVLARQLYQECRWREDIISGRTVSPAGAIGIAQIMPATAKEWNVNPLDPFASIEFAGRYMAWLRNRHHNWAETLAAYNWGTGNVGRKGLAVAPREARDYYTQILGDVNAANGTSLA